MTTTATAQTEGQSRIVLITGPSGAGRSTAINALEDLGQEAVDNMPLSLLPRQPETQLTLSLWKRLFSPPAQPSRERWRIGLPI